MFQKHAVGMYGINKYWFKIKLNNKNGRISPCIIIEMYVYNFS